MKIGRLEKVDPRDLWKGEASDFTPWLAKEENIEILSETIGLELEVINEEVGVGPFRADILCKDTLNDSYVLIENQLEKTDHSHLGQLMTYAAGLDAVTIVWIAKRFTDEHRAALDWLNRVTNSKLHFFGIEIEAYSIGNSDPAPMFKMVSKPNDWTKSISTIQKDSKLTDAQSLYLEYWSAFKDYIEKSSSKIKSQKALAQHWYNFAIGRSDFKIVTSASTRDKFIRVAFEMFGNDAKPRYDHIKNNYHDAVEQISDEEVQWERLDGRQMSWIGFRKDGNVSNKAEWDSHFEWYIDKINKLDEFFRPLVKKMD